MWTRDSLAWAAGIIEGEGHIGQKPQGGWFITVEMTDEDVVRRLVDATGLGAVRGPYGPRAKGTKPTYVWRVGKYPLVFALLAAIWPWLGQRRRVQAARVLTYTPLRQTISAKRAVEVVADRRRTGDSYAVIAARHGISTSRAQQLVATATKERS